jgi:hypothetical protein
MSSPENGILHVRKTNKGFHVEIEIGTKKMPVPNYEVDESMDGKPCEVLRDKGSIIEIIIDNVPLKKKEVQQPSSNRPDYRPQQGSGNSGNPPGNIGPKCLFTSLRTQAHNVLIQKLPKDETGSFKERTGDFGQRRECSQKAALDLILEGNWIPYTIIVKLNPAVTKGMTIEETKQLDFMIKGLFRMAWIKHAKNIEFRRLLGTNKKMWHTWRGNQVPEILRHPMHLQDLPLAWESNLYFKVMDSQILTEFNNGNKLGLTDIGKDDYFLLINIRDYIFNRNTTNLSSVALSIIAETTSLFSNVIYKKPSTAFPKGKILDKYKLSIGNTIVRMNLEYAKEMVSLSYEPGSLNATLKTLYDPNEKFVQDILLNIYNYKADMIKLGKNGISDAYAFNIFEFLPTEDGKRYIQRCLLIDNVRGVFCRAVSYLDRHNQTKYAKEIFENNHIEFYFENFMSTLLYEPKEHYDAHGFYANQLGREKQGKYQLDPLHPSLKESTKIRGLAPKKTELIIQCDLQETKFQSILAQAIQLINLGFFRIGGLKSRGFGMLLMEP